MVRLGPQERPKVRQPYGPPRQPVLVRTSKAAKPRFEETAPCPAQATQDRPR